MILVVENDDLMATLIRRLLTRLRYASQVAGTCEEARDLLRTHPYDLVICDIMLPDGSGLDLMEHARSQPWVADVPLLFCTGDSSALTVERAVRLGALGFIKKPFTVDVVAARVDRAMGRSPRRWRTRRELVARFGIDAHRADALQRAARSALVALQEALTDPGHAELTPLVVAARGACEAIAAVRTVALFDAIWPLSTADAAAPATDARDALRAAVRVELASFDSHHDLAARAIDEISGPVATPDGDPAASPDPAAQAESRAPTLLAETGPLPS